MRHSIFILTLATILFSCGQKDKKTPADEKKPSTVEPGKNNAGNLITGNSAGVVKLGMTVAEVRTAAGPLTLSRTSDGEGVALIAVKSGETQIMTIYAGEENADAPINENGIVSQIEVWDSSYQTDNGVHVGMLLSGAETKYGKITVIMMSEIESREYATFTNQPKGIKFRVAGKDADAGVYTEGQNTTTQYTTGAYIFTIIVDGK